MLELGGALCPMGPSQLAHMGPMRPMGPMGPGPTGLMELTHTHGPSPRGHGPSWAHWAQVVRMGPYGSISHHRAQYVFFRNRVSCLWELTDVSDPPPNLKLSQASTGPALAKD